jgi:hypothetical protein
MDSARRCSAEGLRKLEMQVAVLEPAAPTAREAREEGHTQVMHALEVGQLYHPGRTTWPEAVTYQYRQDHHELLLFWPDPSAHEVEQVRSGAASFGVYWESPALFLVVQLGGMSPMDAVYSWHLVATAERTLPAHLQPETTIALPVILIDAETGIVRVIRLLSLATPTATQLNEAIHAQAKLPWDERAYDAAIGRVYAQGSSRWLAEKAGMLPAGAIQRKA